MTTDKIIAAAREARLLPDNAHPAPETPHMRAKTAALANFYAIAYRQGMERAAEIADGLKEKTLAAQQPTQLDDLTNTQIRMVAHLGHGNCADVIRAHAQNQPKNEHDGGVV